MKDNQDNTNNNLEEELIDIIGILKKILHERILILKITISFFFIGCLVALISPIEYTSQTTFVPQVSDDKISTSNNRLGSLASLAGINLNTTQASSDSYISPLVYTNIIKSEEFSLDLLSKELINTNSEKFTVKEYLLSKQSLFNFNLISFLKKYTIGLFLDIELNTPNSDMIDKYNFINDEDYSLIVLFKNKFKIELNSKEGYIKVLATDENPFISSQLVELITKSLQSKIIEIRTNKIKERLEFSKKQYEIKQTEFDVLQNRLAKFKDSNKNISTAVFLSELQSLESEYRLQENILTSLASEYNSNKIKLNKDTPIFSVIDEVSIPNERSKPRRGRLVITYVFLGLILSLGFVIGKDRLIYLIKEIKD